jgi:hypothetical protein
MTTGAGTPPGSGESPSQIRDALVAGIAQRRRRSRRRLALGGAAATLAAVAIAAATELSDGPSSALALAIESRGSWVEVRIADADASASQMTRELREAEIDAGVRALPVRPGQVGEWVGFQRVGTHTKGGRSGSARADQWRGDIGARGSQLLIRREALAHLDATRIVFYIGRVPRDGEPPYALFENGPRPVGSGGR